MRFMLTVAFICFYGMYCGAYGEDKQKDSVMVKPLKKLPVDGEVFSVNGSTAFIILPKSTVTGGNIPWVWYAPTLPNCKPPTSPRLRTAC